MNNSFTKMKVEKIISDLISFKSISEYENLSLINYISNYLSSFSIKSKVLNGEKDRANLYARIGPDVKGGIMLSGHTDVVPVNGQPWQTEPFNLKVLDNKLFGRGTSDMKSFIAIILYIVPQIIVSKLKKPIHLMFSYDEEIGCVGIQKAIPFIDSLKRKPSACIVGEPTEMKLINQHKGKKNFRVEFQGLESHSSNILGGVNAITFAAKFVLYLLKKEEELKKNYKKDLKYDPPYATINIGKFNGGIALNIIPRNCIVEFELRDLPNTDSEGIISEIKNHLFSNLEKKMKSLDSSCFIKFNVTNNFPPLKTAENKEIVNLCMNCLETNEIGAVSFGTEAGVFNNSGIETIVCGPGSINEAHKPNEYIDITQVKKCEIFLQKIIQTLY